MLSSHQIEPELLRPPPRRARLRGGQRAGLVALGCLQLFVLPFIVVGIGSTAVACLSTLVCLFGLNVPGQLIGRYTSESEDGTTCYLRYDYQVGQQHYQTADAVSTAAYDNYAVGTPVEVRVFGLLPGRGSQLLLPGHTHTSRFLFMWSFALFWNAILSPFVWLFFINPRQIKALVTVGLPTSGRITDKKISSGEDSDTHTIYYEYEPHVTLEAMSSPVAANSVLRPVVAPMQGKMSVNGAEYKQALSGDTVTVLYHPKNPKRSVIYRYAAYEIVV